MKNASNKSDLSKRGYVAQKDLAPFMGLSDREIFLLLHDKNPE